MAWEKQSDKPCAQQIQSPSIITSSMGSIQALLITNLRILPGISVAKPESTLAKNLRIESIKLTAIVPASPFDINEKIQIAALVINVVRDRLGKECYRQEVI
jgi:hypothetical protein